MNNPPLAEVYDHPRYPPRRRARGPLERWLDRYNHIMELCRTLFNLFAITLQVVILLRVFGVI